MNKLYLQFTEFFEKLEWKHHQFGDQPVLHTHFCGDHGRWVGVAVAREEEKAIAFISLFPSIVPVNKRAVCAELLTRLNYGVKHGSFQMDNLFTRLVERHTFMKLEEAIQKAREKLQDPAAKAVVQGEMHYLGIATDDEVKQPTNPGNDSNGDGAMAGKAVVAFKLYVTALMERTRAKPEEAFEAAKVIVYEAFQDTRDNKEFAKCLREVLGQAVEAR